MGFEQLAALRAQLTKEAKLKQQQERADKPAVKQGPKPGQNPGQPPGSKPGPNRGAKPAARPDRPARPARSDAGARTGGGKASPPVDPVVRVIGKLQKRFPAAFPKNPAPKVPLKVGILAELIAQASDLQLSEAEIREAVGTWCRGSRYWACLTDGAPRVDLAGAPAGVVTARDAAFARNQAKGGLGGRRKARGKPDAPPGATGDAAVRTEASAAEQAAGADEATRATEATAATAAPAPAEGAEAAGDSPEV